MTDVELKTVHGEPSLCISNDSVTAWMTLRGNHIAPVTFHSAAGDISPYSLAPWVSGENPDRDAVLDVLRGDFWCLPFGEQPNGPTHGESASEPWTPARITPSEAHVRLNFNDNHSQIDKIVSVREGQSALFQEFSISGLQGDFPYGTHPILDLSTFPAGTARISVGQLRWASVVTGIFSDPALGEHQILAEGATFENLAAVPAADGGSVDLSRYPTAVAHEDLVMLTQAGDSHGFAWTAVSVPGYVWLALKNVQDFPSTLLWVSNGGRTQSPWDGTHVGRLGVEDVCSYFHRGLEESRKNHLSHLGIATTKPFTANQKTTLRTVQAVAPTGQDFGKVVAVETPRDGIIRIMDEQGLSCDAKIDWQFVLHQS